MALPFFGKRVLYSLKRQYSARIVVNRRANQTLDLKSGKRTMDLLTWTFERAMVFDSTLSRVIAQTLSFAPENRQFEYGKQFDIKTQTVIIDQADVPHGWVPLKDDYVGIDDQRYEVVSVGDSGDAFVLQVKELVGQTPHIAVGVSLISNFFMADSAEGSL